MVRTTAVEVHARNPAVRAGLRELLARSGLDVVEGTNALGGPSDVDVLLIDAPRATEGDGRTSVLDAESDGIPTVFLVDRLPPEALAATSRPATARGWLRRDVGEDELAAALHAVAAGLQVIDPLLEPQRDGHLPSATLTEREREVLALIATGLTNRAIALRLGISEHTAKFHVRSILAKLGVSTRTEAVVAAARRGLLWL